MRKLGLSMKPKVRNRYPHFLAEDTAVWSKFLQTDGHRLSDCWYDLRVGTGAVLPGGATELERKISDGVSRKRIDVVCRVEDKLWVVEVKPFANMYAVGQVVSYVRMFIKEFLTKEDVIPVIVCDAFDRDLVDEFDEFGILVFEND